MSAFDEAVMELLARGRAAKGRGPIRALGLPIPNCPCDCDESAALRMMVQEREEWLATYDRSWETLSEIRRLGR